MSSIISKPTLDKLRIDANSKNFTEDAFDETISAFEEMITDISKKAIEFYNQQNYQSAIAYFTAAIDEDPFQNDLRFNRALCYLQYNQPFNALNDSNVIVTSAPLYVNAYALRSICHYHCENMDLAERDLKIVKLYKSEKTAELTEIYKAYAEKLKNEKKLILKIDNYCQEIFFDSKTDWNEIYHHIAKQGFIGFSYTEYSWTTKTENENRIIDSKSWESFKAKKLFSKTFTECEVKPISGEVQKTAFIVSKVIPFKPVNICKLGATKAQYD